MQTLREIFNIHKPDKRPFMDIYDFWFSPIREKVTRILELGVQFGTSMMLWRDFFPNAQIYGLDINIEQSRVKPGTDPRIHLLQGHQQDPNILIQLAHSGPYDIIIDDGSHVGEHQVASWKTLIDYTTMFYVIEDIGINWKNNVLSETTNNVIHHMHVGNPRDISEEAVATIPAMATQSHSIRGIHTYRHMMIFEKIYPYPPEGKSMYGGPVRC